MTVSSEGEGVFDGLGNLLWVGRGVGSLVGSAGVAVGVAADDGLGVGAGVGEGFLVGVGVGVGCAGAPVWGRTSPEESSQTIATEPPAGTVSEPAASEE